MTNCTNSSETFNKGNEETIKDDYTKGYFGMMTMKISIMEMDLHLKGSLISTWKEKWKRVN